MNNKQPKMKLHRFWFTFQDLPKFSKFGLGCGVTAYNREDAIGILKERVFFGCSLPTIHSVTEDIDIRELDQDHIVPNMGLVIARGVWFPTGF